MHGLGNDFVLLDASEQQIELTALQIQRMSHRKFGIGFDQLLVVEPLPEGALADYIYRIYNADGSEIGQCGNGARCVGLYLYLKSERRQSEWVLQTTSTVLKVRHIEDNIFSVTLPSPQFLPDAIPTDLVPAGGRYRLCFEGVEYSFLAVNVGNPHICLLVDDVFNPLHDRLGPYLCGHDCFPDGVNVGFVRVISEDALELQVFERGVGFTLACGSGAGAAVIIARCLKRVSSRVRVVQKGGVCWVQWSGGDKAVLLEGQAKIVFEGVYSP